MHMWRHSNVCVVTYYCDVAASQSANKFYNQLGKWTNFSQFHVKKMYWKCVPNISHHCSGLSVLTNICISFGEYCGWTLWKTQENISALFHMHVGLLKCMNHRLWNSSSTATRVFVQKVVRATIKDTWKSACRKCFHFDGLVQERRNSSALEMELRLSCTNPSTSSNHNAWK